MKFNLAEARLQTIKKLQVQADKWKRYCGKAEDRLDKEMKLNEDLQEEIKKLKQELGEKETSLHYYACMWHVTGGEDTPTKDEIEDYLWRNVRKEDKEEVKRELWEQFGYEEEEE